MPMKLFKKLHHRTGGGGGGASTSSSAADLSSFSAADLQDQLSPSSPDTSSSAVTSTNNNNNGNSNNNNNNNSNDNNDSKARESDFITSEEEFQMQLALALSASSNSDDPDGDQIRAATLLSLGRSGGGGDHRRAVRREEGGGVAAESLSRRYWEYNVLDYDEKVFDGFYDVFETSNAPGSHGRFPQLLDLQTSIGDLGFEVILVSRTIDPDLVELEQVAQCILMDFTSTDVGLWVQKLAELVTDHMGGPVKDANDIVARWMERSTELRTSRQTSLLPIGCIKVGLSRHRALLFKVLADTVGIPCRLVKGSHYTGVDDDVVNIIKLDGEREFLVDLMADPGTLIPADVLSAKDGLLSSYTSRPGKDIIPMEADISHDVVVGPEQSHAEYKGGNRISLLDDRKLIDKRLKYEKGVVLPSIPSSSTNVGSSSTGSTNNLSSYNQSSDIPSPANAFAAKVNVVLENGQDTDSLKSDGLSVVPNFQENVDTTNLFSDLNPFQVIGAGKASDQFKAAANRNAEYQRLRENTASGPGRPQYPLVWKNRPACNDTPTAKQYNNFVEGLFPRKKILMKDHNPSASRVSATAGKAYPEVVSSMSGIADSSVSRSSCSSGDSNSSNVLRRSPPYQLDSAHRDSRYDKFQLSAQNKPGNKAQGLGRQDVQMHDLKEHEKKGKGANDSSQCTYDSFMGPDISSKGSESSCSPSQTIPSRHDPTLDDVAALEIPWEDLVIGERIGLGSYGEVYRADWNGTEVAVKKFLDQDFYGDALDEFRKEVKIMRRLRHPNVVLFLGAVTRPPNLSIISEFLPRGSLYRILHRPKCQIDENRRIKMALDVAKGMNCLHISTPTIVHRDLKSPNLLVDKNWTVKVCDFGLSRLKHSTFLSSKSTAGTPEWMAPEVLRNEPSNEKCDVYSFGVILWELATLRMPWSGMNQMQVVGAVGFQDRRLEIPKDVDPLVSRIILECWHSDPNLRPSFAELTTAIMALQRLVIPSHQDVQSPSVQQEVSVYSSP